MIGDNAARHGWKARWSGAWRPVAERERTMSDKTERPDEVKDASGADKKDAKAWAEQLKKFAFAAAGAVNISQDDVKSFVTKLVEKGEIAQKDGKKIVKELAEKLRKTVKEPAQAAKEAKEAAVESSEKIAESGEKLAERVNASIQRVLHTMNIATRQDVVDLGRQIDELDRKLVEILETVTSPRGKKSAAAVQG
jgi:poly(hydroxyalkanoate) granule-associated protein